MALCQAASAVLSPTIHKRIIFSGVHVFSSKIKFGLTLNQPHISEEKIYQQEPRRYCEKNTNSKT
jgi:hypothetical protein